MSFSEALVEYLDCREAARTVGPGFNRTSFENRMIEALVRMDELAPEPEEE